MQWELLCIESMELLSTSPHKILITFSTIRPAYKTRTYVLDPADYQASNGDMISGFLSFQK